MNFGQWTAVAAPNNRVTGFTFVEVMVAVLVIGMLAGPVFFLYQTSHRMSEASLHELMAVNYAVELGDQLQALAPRFNDLQTAMPGKTVGEIFHSPEVKTALASHERVTSVKLIEGSGSDICLLVSPLTDHFVARSMTFRDISLAKAKGQVYLSKETGTVWEVTIGLSWKPRLADSRTIGATYSLLLRQERP